MKVPNANDPVVESDKIVSYLLNAGHPDNGGKAQFFEGSGFSVTGGRRWRRRCANWRARRR